jgi:hypothetical protein
MKLNKEQILLFSVFIVGIIFGLIFQPFFNIEVDPKINISDLLSMILTAGVGIYLGITISGRQSSSRFEKEFLITEIKRVNEYIDSINVFKNTEEILVDEAAKGFKEINIRLYNFESILSDAHYCKGIESNTLRQAFKLLRESVLHLAPKNGLIKATQSERLNIINNYTAFRKAVFKLIIAINSYNE